MQPCGDPTYMPLHLYQRIFLILMSHHSRPVLCCRDSLHNAAHMAIRPSRLHLAISSWHAADVSSQPPWYCELLSQQCHFGSGHQCHNRWVVAAVDCNVQWRRCLQSIHCQHDSAWWWHGCWLQIAWTPILPWGFCCLINSSSYVCIKVLKNDQRIWWLAWNTDWSACPWVALWNLVALRPFDQQKPPILAWLPWTLVYLCHCLLFAMEPWSWHQRSNQHIMVASILSASLVSCHFLPIVSID